MTHGPSPIDVLIATRNRADSLGRTLASVGAAQQQCAAASVIIVDNGSSDNTPQLLNAWCAAHPRRRWLRFELQGKSRALNAGLSACDAPLVAFTDDDASVGAAWLEALVQFLDAHPTHVAVMGRTLPPDGTSADLAARIALYPGVVPVFDGGDCDTDVTDLIGCNMAVRRSVFAQLGGFNEQLGPGASGLSEDAELARRIGGAGQRIGYTPLAVVHHDVDPQRLTDSYYAEFQQRLMRSLYAMHPQWSSGRAARRFVEGLLASAWWRALGQPAKRQRARARAQKHLDALRWLQRHRWRR